jgi:formyltetrahydrofolate deformylase
VLASGATAILLIRCPDQRGLVARTAQFVAERNGNLVHAEHHIDPATGLFLMRLEWELEGFELDRDAIGTAFAPLADEIDAVWSLHFSDVRPTIAIWATREEHCLGDLLLRHRAGELRCDVAFVLSNHADLAPLAASFAVPFHHVPVDADDKKLAEEQQLTLVTDYAVDVIVLAKYMQILTPELIAAFERTEVHEAVDRLPDHHRIINIHHSFLPAFVGANPYERAFERGVKIIGATAHYVTGELDAGPIIEQDTIRASHRDSVDDLIRKGRDLERVVLARAVRSHVDNRILVHGNRTSVFD